LISDLIRCPAIALSSPSTTLAPDLCSHEKLLQLGAIHICGALLSQRAVILLFAVVYHNRGDRVLIEAIGSKPSFDLDGSLAVIHVALKIGSSAQGDELRAFVSAVS
jgi:hypothetical protein